MGMGYILILTLNLILIATRSGVPKLILDTYE